MRLTPKSLFFALVSLGLPFAVMIGWALGETSITQPPAATTPVGFGGFGAAPERDNSVDYGPSVRKTRAPAPLRTERVGVLPRAAASNGPPASAVPSQPPAEPSVPAPSAIPSESTPSAEPSIRPS